MKPIPILFITTILLLTQACSSLQPSGSKVLQVGKSNNRVVTFPSNRRGAYFIDKNSQMKFCAEPAPDVARESFRELSARINANIDPSTKVDAAAQSRLDAKALELAGRTELLLVAREMLYRACELSLNNDISEETVLRLYTNVSELIRALALKDKKQAETDLFDAKARVLREERAIKSGANAFKKH
jgi:hypothetical protein